MPTRPRPRSKTACSRSRSPNLPRRSLARSASWRAEHRQPRKGGAMENTPKMTKYDERSPERVKQRLTIAPRVDVYENANELLLIADVPGATQESVSIQLDKGQLTIEASRADETSGTPLVAEYRPTDYARIF